MRGYCLPPLILAGVVVIGVAACSAKVTGTSGDGGQPDGPSGGDLVIEPAEVSLDVTPGVAAPTQTWTAKTSNGTDVTAMATWSVDDAALGVFSGATFTPGTARGGTSLVRAQWQGLSGFATVHVKLHARVTDTCPGCPPVPPDTAPACDASHNPTVVYPPNGALLPPNTNVIEVQFDQGTGNTLFEVDFQNAVTDVRVVTRCAAIVDSKGFPTNGCGYELGQTVWDYVAESNRGGDPVTVIVRGTDDSGACAARSPADHAVSFATEALQGGIYYWQSVAVVGAPGRTGGIFRYDFGKRGQIPEAFLAPSGTVQRCIGCHYLSRDGLKMAYGNDDPDSDDEYSDLKASLLDVATKVASAKDMVPPGFQTFSPDHKLFLASDGRDQNTPPAFFLYDGETGKAASPAKVPTGARSTQPDWSPDGKSVVFVRPSTFLANSAGGGGEDDNHFIGGSLFTMGYDGSFGAPAPLLPSGGENNFYPAYSPDGRFIAFNRVPAQAAALDQDAFSNPRARVLLVAAAAGSTPIDLPALNAAGDLSNSWPRFSPFVQQYKGNKIVWVTFSSTRDYGLRVENSHLVDGMPQENCYPPETPENNSTNKNDPLAPNCRQPQIWMAAINLSAAEGGAGDPSYPALWLPFQDVAAHNHIAQWVVSIVGPNADGGTCAGDGEACSATVVCCTETCLASGHCGLD